MRPTLLALGIVAVFVTSILGQNPSSKVDPSFEVASVRQNTSGDFGGSYGVRGRQLVVRNYTLRDIILNAYGLRIYQLAGTPDWITTTRYDIVAQAPEGAERDTRMVHTLLADRFKLRVHTETRQAPIFELVVGRADGRLGPQMRPADAGASRSANTIPGQLRFRAHMTADLARQLSNAAGRLVLDRTGLTGLFTGELMWAPDTAPPGASIDPNAPSLFTAVQEQLGLRLAPATGPVEILVIDSVERPTPD